MAKNSTIILNKDDVNNPLYIDGELWQGWMETLGIDPDANEVCLQLSPMDENKKVED